MPFDRILVAVDGSRGGLSATRIARDMAVWNDAQVIVVHAVPMPPVVLDTDQEISDQSIAWLEERAEQAVARAAEVLEEKGVAYERVIRAGGAAEVVLDVAEEHDVDLIVVGHRGLSAAKRAILGSVSSKLAHHARCAVLLAPVDDGTP